MTNKHPKVATIKRRAKTIRARLRTVGPCHADTADLLDYVEFMVMQYEAAADALTDALGELRECREEAEKKK